MPRGVCRLRVDGPRVQQALAARGGLRHCRSMPPRASSLGAGAGGARPQAAFKAAGRGMLSDVQTEIEACLGKSSSVA